MHKEVEKDPVLKIPSNFREEDELAYLKDSADIDKLRSILEENEIVYRLVKCWHDDSEGVLAATNKRIIFADQRFMTSKVVTYKYREVAAVVYNTQIVTQYITLVHSSRPFTVEKVDMEHGERFVDFIKDAIGGDYTLQQGGKVIRHNDDMLRLNEVPAMNEDIRDSLDDAEAVSA
jgi:hypothetical protein